MDPAPSNDCLPDGDFHGVDTLFPLVYDELRRMANIRFLGERQEHTLQPTAVVNEAYVRLKGTQKQWQNEAEFRRYAAPVIRHILVDYARSRPANTRVLVTSWEAVDAKDEQGQDAVEVLALNEALECLEKQFPEPARVVELHYFGGLTAEETAKAAGMPLGTAKSRLKFARAFLKREFTRTPKR